MRDTVVLGVCVLVLSACQTMPPVEIPGNQPVPYRLVDIACLDKGELRGVLYAYLDKIEPLMEQGHLWGFRCHYQYYDGANKERFGVTVDLFKDKGSAVVTLDDYLVTHGALPAREDDYL